MVEASGYILRVREERRKILLESVNTGGWFGATTPSEPVPSFEHSRRAPLLVFASFSSTAITHLARGKRGTSAGTDLQRLNLLNIEPLERPITFRKLLSNIAPRYKSVLTKRLKAGGYLTPKTFRAVVEALIKIDDSLHEVLDRYCHIWPYEKVESVGKPSP